MGVWRIGIFFQPFFSIYSSISLSNVEFLFSLSVKWGRLTFDILREFIWITRHSYLRVRVFFSMKFKWSLFSFNIQMWSRWLKKAQWRFTCECRQKINNFQNFHHRSDRIKIVSKWHSTPFTDGFCLQQFRHQGSFINKKKKRTDFLRYVLRHCYGMILKLLNKKNCFVWEGHFLSLCTCLLFLMK